MNILTGVVLLVLAAFTFNGWRRGFVRVFAHMFFFLLSSVMVYFATPYISGFLTEYTPVYDVIEESCRDALGDGLDQVGDTRLEQKKFIEGLGLPETLERQLVNGNNGDNYEGLDITDFSDYIAGYLAELILNILTFVIALFVVNIILRVTILTLDNLARLPVLHSINKGLGLVLGLAQGMLIVWVAFLVITAMSCTEIGQELMAMIQESAALKYLYNMNIFLEYLL